MSFPAASVSPSAHELTTTLLSQATRDRVDEFTRGMIQGITAPSSVLVVASAGAGMSHALSGAWQAVFAQDTFIDELHALIQEAGTQTAQSLGKRILPRAELDRVLAGDAATLVADDQFGLVVNHWKQDTSAVTFSSFAIDPFEITLSVFSKTELENHRQFTQDANEATQRLAAKRASSQPNSKSPIPAPKF